MSKSLSIGLMFVLLNLTGCLGVWTGNPYGEQKSTVVEDGVAAVSTRNRSTETAWWQKKQRRQRPAARSNPNYECWDLESYDAVLFPRDWKKRHPAPLAPATPSRPSGMLLREASPRGEVY